MKRFPFSCTQHWFMSTCRVTSKIIYYVYKWVIKIHYIFWDWLYHGKTDLNGLGGNHIVNHCSPERGRERKRERETEWLGQQMGKVSVRKAFAGEEICQVIDLKPKKKWHQRDDKALTVSVWCYWCSEESVCMTAHSLYLLQQPPKRSVFPITSLCLSGKENAWKHLSPENMDSLTHFFLFLFCFCLGFFLFLVWMLRICIICSLYKQI